MHLKKIIQKLFPGNLTTMDDNEIGDDLKMENNKLIFLKKSSIEKNEIVDHISIETEHQIEEESTKIEETETVIIPLKDKYKTQGELIKKEGKELLKKMKLIKEKEITEKEFIEKHLKLRKKYEENLQTSKQEAKIIETDEEVWKNKINEEFALQNMLCFTINLNKLPVTPNCVNNEDESLMSKTDKKRFIQFTNNLLNDLIKNNQVFDPGNLMQQLIKKHLNITQNRQVIIISIIVL